MIALYIICTLAYFFIGLGAYACGKNNDCMFEARKVSSYGQIALGAFWPVYACVKIGYLSVCRKDA